jgi:phosphatidylserine/phosphatidylglycerophosphate/cardiolipin synthase-like enzyme
MVASLSAVALPQLEHLLRLVSSGDLTLPLTSTALQARGLGAIWSEVAWLSAIDRTGLEAALQIAISERLTRPVPRLDLVWTGPEAKVSAARDTAVVVRELFNLAQRDVLVAGFRVDGGKTIFEPLQGAMRDRGVNARFFLNFPARQGMTAEDAAARGAEEFLHHSWPPGGPTPAIYFDPRTVAPGSRINLHAKCVIVDGRHVLIGSANFTHNAHVRSIELGVLIEDVSLATELTRQWQGLIDSGLVAAFNHS